MKLSTAFRPLSRFLGATAMALIISLGASSCTPRVNMGAGFDSHHGPYYGYAVTYDSDGDYYHHDNGYHRGHHKNKKKYKKAKKYYKKYKKSKKHHHHHDHDDDDD